MREANEPEYAARILRKDSRNKRIMLPRNSLSLYQDSFCSRGPGHWNQLPTHIRMEKALGRFKTKTINWILANVSQFEE